MPRLPVMLAREIAGGQMSDEAAAWLREGFAQYLADERLEVALQLDRGQRVRQRNRALLDVAKLLDRQQSLWELSATLERAIGRFEAQVWPRSRRVALPNDLGEIDMAIFAAYAARCGMLTSQRALYDLLKPLNKNETPFSESLAP